MKIVVITLLLLIASYCIDAKCPKCNADSCLGCTKHSNCIWCDNTCQSKTAKIFCSSKIEQSANCPAGCDYGGKHYSVGEEFMDDCNTCTCNEDGIATCTLMLCTPGCEAALCPVDTYCEEDENGHPVCKPLDEENPCNLIDCGDGKVCYINENEEADCKDDPCMTVKCGWGEICVTKSDGTADCVAPSTCEYNGETYQNGDSFPSDDGCNQCSCTDDGMVVCTLRACIAPDCQTNDDCKSGFYCKKDSCDDTLEGVCTKREEICTDHYDPVCGCDGQRYGNDCDAASAGVNIKSKGECEGGSQEDCESNSDCKSDHYCQKESCDDQKGSCAVKSDFCTLQHDPVCGCDGQTYGNDCMAASAGVNIKSDGECEGGSQEGCESDSDCKSDSYCQKESCDDEKGSCAVKSELCTAEHDPVCGCDGMTYGNECEAAAAGVNIKSDGECEGGSQDECESDSDCKSDSYCQKESCDDQKGYCSERVEGCTKEFDPVCGCDGQTYGNECMAASAGVNIKSNGECEEGSQEDCESDSDCKLDSYCQKESCDDEKGSCAVKSELCTLQHDPVCGCDGKTYGNECEAGAAGVNVASKGECEGGSQDECKSDSDCKSDSYCQKESCDDEKGSCAVKSELCTLQHDPVCGCDGMTYGNECEAAAAGVNVASNGECEGGSQEDCESDSDCKSDSYCQKESCDDEKGSCAVKSELCTQQRDPVCGCDGMTYGNECEAAAAGVNVASNGECEIGGGMEGECTSNYDCDEGFFCDFYNCAQDSGFCTENYGDLCASVVEPVCGCDGVTYNNDCERAIAGVSRLLYRECPVCDPPCEDGKSICCPACKGETFCSDVLSECPMFKCAE